MHRGLSHKCTGTNQNSQNDKLKWTAEVSEFQSKGEYSKVLIHYSDYCIEPLGPFCYIPIICFHSQHMLLIKEATKVHETTRVDVLCMSAILNIENIALAVHK